MLLPFAIVTLIWGSTWIVIRDQIGHVPPSWSVTYRFLVAGVAMLGYAAWRGERPGLDARGWGIAAAMGLLQFCCNFNFVYRAEHFVTSGLVAVVFALLLVPNALLGWLVLGQRPGHRLLVGSAVAMAGVALLFVREARDDPHGTGATFAGIGFTLLGVMSASLANILQATPAARRYPMVPTLGVAMLIGAAMDAGVAWMLTGPPVLEFRPAYLLGIVYLGLIASAVAFTLYFGLLRVIGAARAAYSSVIVPVIAMGFSTLFEQYRWNMLAGLGAALALGGLCIALIAPARARTGTG